MATEHKIIAPTRDQAFQQAQEFINDRKSRGFDGGWAKYFYPSKDAVPHDPFDTTYTVIVVHY